MNARAKATGMKGFVNLGLTPECLNCGSLDLEDLSASDAERQQIREDRQRARSRPEYAELITLLKRWENSYSTRRQTEKKIRNVGMRIAQEGVQGLMYSVCTSIDRRSWQNVVSSCWDGIGGWMH